MLYEGKILTEEEIKADPFGWMKNKPVLLSTRFQESFSVDVQV